MKMIGLAIVLAAPTAALEVTFEPNQAMMTDIAQMLSEVDGLFRSLPGAPVQMVQHPCAEDKRRTGCSTTECFHTHNPLLFKPECARLLGFARPSPAIVLKQLMPSPEPMPLSMMERFSEEIGSRFAAPTEHFEVSFEDSEGHQWHRSSDGGMPPLPQSFLKTLGLKSAPPPGIRQFFGSMMPQPSPVPVTEIDMQPMEMRPLMQTRSPMAMEMRPPSHPCQVEVERCSASGATSRSEIQCCLASRWDGLSGTCQAFMAQVLDKETLERLTMENLHPEPLPALLKMFDLGPPPRADQEYELAPHMMRNSASNSDGPSGYGGMPDHMASPPHHHGPLCMLLMPLLFFMMTLLIVRRCLGLAKTQPPQFAAFVEPEPISIKTRLEPLVAHDIAKVTTKPVQAQAA